MMAEFNYEKKMAPTLPFLAPEKERWFWWMVKVHMLKPNVFSRNVKSKSVKK